MELVDGETLDQRLQRQGPVSPGELAELVFQACEGVQAAHEARIVHRDLKPENLIVTTRGGAPFVKILDFGISKFDERHTGGFGITTEGMMLGTPYYMSPEQVRGASLIDFRTDIYSLGVILYECACGTVPFDAKSIEALAVRIHEGNPRPLAERDPTLPADFCAIVHRAMMRDPADRFESARALGDALDPLRVRMIRGSSTGAPPPRTVVRSSLRPPPNSETVVQSGVLPSTDAGLAATMGSGRVRARGWLPRVAGASALVVVVGAATAAIRLAHRPSPAAAGDTGRGVDAASGLRAVELSPLPVQAPEATASATPVPVSGTPASGRASPLAASSDHPASRELDGGRKAFPSSLTPAPATQGSAKSRVDQTGLAGENPFK
jgi:serine/threonine-protein kinase